MGNSHDNGDDYDYDEMDETQMVDANMFDETQLVSSSVASQFAARGSHNDDDDHTAMLSGDDATAMTRPESLSGVLGETAPLTAPLTANLPTEPLNHGPQAPVPTPMLDALDPFSGKGAISDPNLDFGPPGGWGEPAGIDEESEAHGGFLETSVLPIPESDQDALGLNQSIDGRFELLGLLGEGGMGKVYRAKQTSVGRDVAIKVLHSNMGKNEEVRERFLREAQLISGFSHPNIVRLVDFGETKEGRLYLAMEYVNGKTLSDVFGGQKLQPQFVLEMARQVASALIEAHSQGVVHRDLKPENIFLTRIVDGSIQFKVLDFGVAKTSTSGLTATGTVYGTPTYMAPEQAQGLKVTEQTDLYAIGVMMYQFLTGKVPFSGQPLQVMLMHVKDDPPYLLDRAPHLPDEVVEVVHSLLSKNPEDRIASSTALCDTLEHIMNMNGWGRSYRLPPGPLMQTTKEWHLDENAQAASGFQMDGLAFDSVTGLQDKKRRPTANAGESNIPKPKFEKLELDLPQEPGPRSARPAPAASGGTRTQDRPRARKARGSSQGRSNGALIGILAILVLAAGGLGYAVFSGKLSVSAISNGPVQAEGDAKIILQAVQDQGWTVPFVTDTNLGTVRIQAAKVEKDGSVIEVAIHGCESAQECRVTWNEVGPPAVGYLKDRTLVRLEPMGASVSTTDMQLLMSAIKSAYPGGVPSSGRF